MANVGEQADMLRALGQALDRFGAGKVEIASRETFLSVTWPEGPTHEGHTSYQEHDLEELRARAREMRTGVSAGGPLSRRAELLRTLGQELDQRRIEMMSVVEETDGFLVSGSADGKYVRHLFATRDLLQLSAERQAMRGFGASTGPASSMPDVAIGTPIFSQDNWRVGSVKQMTGDRFEVKAPALQRDYWLPATSIANATRESVLLGITKDQVDEIRSRSPASAA
jgi:hypothetical protein